MDDIRQVLLFQIERTTKLSKVYSQRIFDQEGVDITIEQWILLKIIHENQPLSQKQIAEKSLRDPAAITRTVDILEKKGLVTRQRSTVDRRQHDMYLTQNGKQFITDHFPLVQGMRDQSMKGLSNEELKTLQELLRKVQSNFE
ncbi:MarR family winged helix-turn-helix transcriptional regulator [Sanyastnella coralliicola]|uniref:MarR family winged helix-turn-helix transcriptional regulator n=1 Tax=Sanyastnella coralliicola TaxID=3069118 RepID=UPI0027BB0591|nr:MarR family transcriptional regulator [Longitalea sp. SCSIO 12813]